MKKAEQIIYEHYGCSSWEEVCRDFLSDISPTMIKEIVKIAQIDAIEETVKRCIKNVKVLHIPFDPFNGVYNVNTESILKVAEELKKELE